MDITNLTASLSKALLQLGIALEEPKYTNKKKTAISAYLRMGEAMPFPWKEVKAELLHLACHSSWHLDISIHQYLRDPNDKGSGVQRWRILVVCQDLVMALKDIAAALAVDEPPMVEIDVVEMPQTYNAFDPKTGRGARPCGPSGGVPTMLQRGQ